MGCLIKPQRGKGKSKNYTLQYVGSDGKRCYESAGTSVRAEAKAKLVAIEARIAAGEQVIRENVGRKGCTLDDALAIFEDVQARENRPSRGKRLNIYRRHLAPYFGATTLLNDITTARVDAYDAMRRAAGAKRLTINGELGLLRRLFKLASEKGRYRGSLPHISTPDDGDSARAGFFERAEYEAMMTHLPAWFRGPLTFAYWTGWRMPSEVGALRWSDVDLDAGVLSIRKTKNGKGRTVPYAALPALVEVFATADAERRRLQQRGVIVSHVFHRDGHALVEAPSGTRRVGNLKTFVYKAWHAAAKAAGVAGRIPHDLRRTAVRNLVRAGIPRSIAKRITGHITEHVFERYNIVDERDLTQALGSYGKHYARRRRARTGGSGSPAPAVAPAA